MWPSIFIWYPDYTKWNVSNGYLQFKSMHSSLFISFSQFFVLLFSNILIYIYKLIYWHCSPNGIVYMRIKCAEVYTKNESSWAVIRIDREYWNRKYSQEIYCWKKMSSADFYIIIFIEFYSKKSLNSCFICMFVTS